MVDLRRSEVRYYDSWRGEWRTARFAGKCVVCGTRTFVHDDGDDDPRGVLGDRAASPLYAVDFGAAGPDVPLCSRCANEVWAMDRALAYAWERWERA